MNLADHLDKLKAFKVIVESGTMREAASRLNVTQPSLTKLVQNLETAAKTVLLVRGRKGVAPTPAGSELFKYACSILNDLEDLEQKMRHPANRMAGHLRIGAFASLAEYLWPEFIPAFRNKAPALKISIFTSESVSHREALASGKIDVLVDAEPKLAEDFISWNLYEDRFNFYISKSQAETWDPGAVDSTPLIYSPAAYDHDSKRIIQHLEKNGYFFKERMEFDSFMAVLAFAKKGLGLAVLPNRLAHAAVSAGQLRPVAIKNFSSKGFGTHHFAATIQESRKTDPRIRLLVTELRAWFRDEKKVR